MADAQTGTRLRRAIAQWLRRPLPGALLRAATRVVAPRHRIGALVVVLDGRDRFLLVEHLFRPDQPWGLPGGWVNRREDPHDAARRELLEETNLEIEIGPVVALRGEPRPWHVTIVFAGRLQGGDFRLSGELNDFLWVYGDDIPSDLPPFEREAIAAARDWNSG